MECIQKAGMRCRVLGAILGVAVAIFAVFTVILAIRETRLRVMAQTHEKEKADEERRRLDNAIAARDQEIEKLKPKPLKDRICALLDAITPSVLQQAATGTRMLRVEAGQGYITELERLRDEDQDHTYIQRIEPMGMRNTDGAIFRTVILTITDRLAD